MKKPRSVLVPPALRRAVVALNAARADATSPVAAMATTPFATSSRASAGSAL